MRLVTVAIAASLLAVPAHGDSHVSARCNQVSIRLDTLNTDEPILKLHGTRDSVPDGRYYVGKDGAQRDSITASRPAFAVYGQVFSVHSLSEKVRVEIGDAKRVVLIWWSVTPGCGRYKPLKTIQHADSNIVLAVAPRKRAQWINNIPTFDVPNGTWLYVNGHDGTSR